MLSAVLMSETFGIGGLKPDQTETKVQLLQRIEPLPFVFDSIFEAAGHIVVVVPPLVQMLEFCRFS